MSTFSATPAAPSFRNAERRQESLLAPVERKALAWLAAHTPRRIGPDHLTIVGLCALALAGISYAAAAQFPPALLLVNFWLAVNWLGDSLDGTLARYRQQQRPRYGFYVDHIVDSFGALFVLAGLAWSGLMSERIALALLIAFLLLSIDSYLAAYTRGKFNLSFWLFSPTELRILLALGNVVTYWKPDIVFLGETQPLFNVGGAIGAVCMAAVLVVNVTKNTASLYKEERIPKQ
jgi:archaetidylinositol phosphate synthase